MNLIDLFNRGWEFARVVQGRYVGCMEQNATHRLVCTEWNKPLKTKDPRAAIRDAKTRPDGVALSVCAIPLRGPRIGTASFRIRKPMPVTLWPVYEAKGSLHGKRKLLIWLARETVRKPAPLVRRIKTLSAAKCDALYRTFVRQNQQARRKKRQ